MRSTGRRSSALSLRGLIAAQLLAAPGVRSVASFPQKGVHTGLLTASFPLIPGSDCHLYGAGHNRITWPTGCCDGDLVIITFRDEQSDGNAGQGLLQLNNSASLVTHRLE